jgi:hypothetical protein
MKSVVNVCAAMRRPNALPFFSAGRPMSQQILTLWRWAAKAA